MYIYLFGILITLVLFLDTKEKILTHFGLLNILPGTIDKTVYTSIHTSTDVFTVCLSIECLEDFTGGLFWEVAFDGDEVSKPCRAIDERFRYLFHYCTFTADTCMPLLISYM